MLFSQSYIDDLKNPADLVRRLVSVGALASCLYWCIGGQVTSKATLVDEFGEVCSEDLMARIDYFFIKLAENPSETGLIIFHGRKDSVGRNQYLLRYMSTAYPSMRRFDTSRFKVMQGELRDEQKIQFWLVPVGAENPSVSRLGSSSYSAPYLFDRAPVGFHRWFGALNIYDEGFWDLGCNFSPNRGLFAKTLKENRDLNAFLIVYTKSGKSSQGGGIASFALNDLVVNFGIPRKRIRAIYGGSRKVSEIEFWLVPRGHKYPSSDPARPPIRTY